MRSQLIFMVCLLFLLSACQSNEPLAGSPVERYPPVPETFPSQLSKAKAPLGMPFIQATDVEVRPEVVYLKQAGLTVLPETIVVRARGDYIYGTGYLSLSGGDWIPVSLSEETWVRKRLVADIELPGNAVSESSDNYLAVYVCKKRSSCGVQVVSFTTVIKPVPIDDTGDSGLYTLFGYSNTRGTGERVKEGILTPDETWWATREEKLILTRIEDPVAWADKVVDKQLGYDIKGHWVQLGLADDNRDLGPEPKPEHIELARTLVEIIHEKSPHPIIISPMTPYAEGHICDLAGPYATKNSNDITDILVSEYDYVYKGPTFPELSADNTKDGCHPTDARYEVNADILEEFLINFNPN